MIPSLLLSVPTPEIKEEFIDGRVLTLPVEKAEEFAAKYKKRVATFFQEKKFDLSEDIIPALKFGLRLFNAENFTGELSSAERDELAAVLQRFEPYFKPSVVPEEEGEAKEEEAKEGEKKEEEEEYMISKQTPPKDAYLQRLLMSDGEMPSPCVKLPGLLLCLVAIVSTDLEDGNPLVPFTCIWRLRVHYRHQLILKHRAHQIFVQIASCIDAILQRQRDDSAAVTVGELLEVSYAQSYYHRRELAEETVSQAVKKSGLTVKEQCLEGVRTRWQQHQLPQLLLQADGTRSAPEIPETEEQPVVKLSEKDGHDLLDRPRPKPEAEPLPCQPLHPEDKAILLLMAEHIRDHSAHHVLTTHRMVTYIERLLVDPAPTPFVVQCQILLARSRLETRRNRVQERAFMQITELVEQYSTRRDPKHRTFQRTESEFFYSVPYPTWWDLKTEYADFCFEENLFKTALSMYEEVQDWEKIIECCKKLDKRRRAESLARELLETDPQNPMLWVALGEATRRDEHLWKAWELCNHKMAAPMRSLARLALDRERYEDVIQFFDKAVSINPIFGGDWFSLGFACLKMKRWERSGEAFTRVCQMNPNDAYAWNNLGSIMMRSNKKRPAFNAISQALRQNRRDWRMWQNYFNIGCELKEVTETANALNIALDIAKRQLEFERPTLELFVDNTIAYLKGEIPGMSSEAQDSEEVQERDHVRYRSMMVNDNCPEEDVIKHVPVGDLGTDEDEFEEEQSELVPFGADLPPPEAAVQNAVKNTEERERIAKSIRLRHRHRTRALFFRIMDLFVNNPDIYFCAAKLVNYLEGPLAAYAYKVKELCVCHQKDLWEQQEPLFKRTVEALETTVSLLEDAYKLISEAIRNPDSAMKVPDPNVKEEADYMEKLEQASFAPIPEPYVSGVPIISIGSEVYQKAFLLSVKETQNNIKRTLQTTEPHFGETDLYRQLESLEPKLKRTLQEAKDEFDL